MRKLNISLKSKAVLTVNRFPLNSERLVYVLVANRQLRYRHGRSSIAYIGTTKKGLSRIAESAAFHADEILNLRGVTNVTAKILTCKSRPNVKTWRKLERAMLLTFREVYGEIPDQNHQGEKIKQTDEFKYFNQSAIRKIIGKLS